MVDTMWLFTVCFRDIAPMFTEWPHLHSTVRALPRSSTIVATPATHQTKEEVCIPIRHSPARYVTPATSTLCEVRNSDSWCYAMNAATRPEQRFDT